MTKVPAGLNNVVEKFAEENRNISARLADSESELENCETMRADALQNISTLAEHHADISARLADSESLRNDKDALLFQRLQIMLTTS